MKKLFSILLLFSLLLSFTACEKEKSTTTIPCEQIIKAYEDAGCTLEHHLHEDPIYTKQGICCSLLFKNPDAPDKNYIYIDRYYTVDGAREADKEHQYNPVIWFMSALYGETRWLKSGRFGEIHYTTYENKMIKPLREAVK